MKRSEMLYIIQKHLERYFDIRNSTLSEMAAESLLSMIEERGMLPPEDKSLGEINWCGGCGTHLNSWQDEHSPIYMDEDRRSGAV